MSIFHCYFNKFEKNDLLNVYGKENTEMIKMCFGKIIYLLSNDIYTLEEISKYH